MTFVGELEVRCLRHSPTVAYSLWIRILSLHPRRFHSTGTIAEVAIGGRLASRALIGVAWSWDAMAGNLEMRWLLSESKRQNDTLLMNSSDDGSKHDFFSRYRRWHHIGIALGVYREGNTFLRDNFNRRWLVGIDVMNFTASVFGISTSFIRLVVVKGCIGVVQRRL